jgi:hypothetical protein
MLIFARVIGEPWRFDPLESGGSSWDFAVPFGTSNESVASEVNPGAAYITAGVAIITGGIVIAALGGPENPVADRRVSQLVASR